MSMMEMASSSPRDSLGWPKIYLGSSPMPVMFTEFSQFTIRIKKGHYIPLSYDFTPLGLCVWDSKHFPLYGKLNTAVTHEIANEFIQHSPNATIKDC